MKRNPIKLPKNIPGVYVIESSISNRIYVGSSKDVVVRWEDHLRRLKSNTHENKRLQDEYNSVGDSSFLSFSLVEEFEEPYEVTNEFRKSREEYYIQLYDAQNTELGFNIANAYGSKPLSAQQKDMISKTHKGKKISDRHRETLKKRFSGKGNNMYGKKGKDNPNYGKHYGRTGKDNHKSIPVVQLSMDGDFIAEFESMGEAEKLGFNHDGISKCCKREYKHHKGYKWMYKHEYDSM